MVADRMKEYIRKSGMKQGAIAARAGITDKKMSEYMTGRAKLTADTFFILCDAIGVEADIFAPSKKSD